MFPNPTGNRVIHWKGHAGLPFRWQIGHQQVRPDRVPHWFIEPNAHCLDFSERRKANRQLVQQPWEGLLQRQICSSFQVSPRGVNTHRRTVVIECQSACDHSSHIISSWVNYRGMRAEIGRPVAISFCRQASTESRWRRIGSRCIVPPLLLRGPEKQSGFDGRCVATGAAPKHQPSRVSENCSRRREEADFLAQIARFSASSRRRLHGLGIVQTRSLAKRAVFRAFGFSHPLLSVSKLSSWFTVTTFVMGVLLFLGAGGPLSLGTG